MKSDGGTLITPCIDEPKDHFRFEYDSQAKIASVYGETTHGETTEILLGLNRPELRKYRSKFVTKLECIALSAETSSKAKEIFEEAQRDSEEYSAFARALARRLNNDEND